MRFRFFTAMAVCISILTGSAASATQIYEVGDTSVDIQQDQSITEVVETPTDEPTQQLIETTTTDDSSSTEPTPAEEPDTTQTSGNISVTEQENAELIEDELTPSENETAVMSTNTLTGADLAASYLKVYGNAYANKINAAYETEHSDAYVDETTGSMAANVTDLYIPGKNGFDIRIDRTFKTISSPMREYYSKYYNGSQEIVDCYAVKYLCTNNNEEYDIYFYNEEEMLEAYDSFMGGQYDYDDATSYQRLRMTGSQYEYVRVPNAERTAIYEKAFYCGATKEYPQNDAQIQLGGGWCLQIPSIIEYDTEVEDGYYYHYLVFQNRECQLNTFDFSTHLNSNSDMVASGFSTIDDIDSVLSFVNAENVYETNTHPAGFNYNISIEQQNGETYYCHWILHNSAKIVGMSDRYGNVIKVDHTADKYTITDTYGVIYECTKDGITRIVDDVTTELVKYEYVQNNSDYDIYNEFTLDDEIVFTVTKNSGTSNTISENEPDKTQYFMNQKLAHYEWFQKGWMIYKLPYKVITPTGLTKHFAYSEAGNWRIGFDGDITNGNYYYVTDYYEQSDNTSDIKNHRTYEYTTGIPGAANERYHISQTVVKTYNDDELINTRTVDYDYNSFPIIEKTGTQYSDTYIQKEYTYMTRYPLGRVKEQYTLVDGRCYNTVYFTHSGYKTASEKNGDYIRNYTYYESNYDLPHTTTYTKDANTTVKIENLLTEDGKSIATQNVYENDVLKSTVNYTYDSYGNVASQSIPREDGTSATTTYAYTYADDGGYTLTTTQSGILDADGTEQSNIVTSQTFDWRGNIISATDANGNTTTTTYDLLNRPLTITYPDTSVETYAYDMVNNESTLVTESDAKYYATFDDWGNRIKFERGCINYTNRTPVDEYTYNNLGQLDSYKRYYSSGDYTQSKYTYDYLGRTTAENVYNENNTLLKTTTYDYGVSYDSNGKTTTSVTCNVSGDNGTYASYKETYNYLGHLIETKQTSGSEQRTYTYTNDYVGNALSVTDPKGNVASYTYDYANRPLTETNAAGGTKTYTYNSLGLVSSESDYMNNVATYTYDNAGRMLTKTAPFDVDLNSFQKIYYDANGNVTRTMVQSDYTSGETSFDTVDYSYDNMNRIAYTATYPTTDAPIYTVYSYSDEGYLQSIIYGNNTPTTTMSADAAKIGYLCNIHGELVVLETSDRIECYTYDNQGRLTYNDYYENIYSLDGRYIRYQYDCFDNVIHKESGTNPETDKVSISYTYNILGQRTSMTDSSGTTNYTYSPFGELTQETKGGIIKSYTYDAMSNRTGFSLTTDGTQQINSSYTYDALNRLTQYSGNGFTASYQYDANSNLIQTTKPDGSVETSTYNLANHLTKRERYVGETLMEQYFYAYYINGKTASHRNWFEGGTEAGSYNRYFYDGAGRLRRDLRLLSYKYDDEYTYDARGNRIQMVRLDRDNGNTTTTTTYTYDKGNKLLTQSDGTDTYAYSYSKYGEMTAVTKNGEVYKSFGYDNLGRLISSTVGDITATYTYDGDNMRQSKTINGVASNEIYDGANLVAVSKTDGISKYLRGNGLVAYQTPDANGMYDISPAGHVSVTYPLNSDGSANTSSQSQYIYGAFGKRYTPSPTTDTANPFTHNGEVTDSDTGTGLIYLRNRYYDPEIGRFLTVDPAMDGTNWYAYCNNDPVNFVDPWGTAWTEKDKEVYNKLQEAGMHGFATSFYLDIEAATDMYDSANGNHDTMNQARRNAVNARVEAYEAVGMSYYDDYDYTYAGNYYSSTNDTVTDVGWVIPAVAVGGAAIAKAGPAVVSTLKGSIATKSGQTVAIGTSFGKLGNLIENPGIKIQNISAHALERMAERGVTQKMLETWVSTGKALEQSGGKIMYITKEGVAIVSKAGNLITTYSKQYFDATMQSVVNQLFGK